MNRLKGQNFDSGNRHRLPLDVQWGVKGIRREEKNLKAGSKYKKTKPKEKGWCMSHIYRNFNVK